MIVESDKGNSIVIPKIKDYNDNITNFINDNQFTKTNRGPSDFFQNYIRKIIKSSKSLNQQEHKWRYFNLNPLPCCDRRTYQNTQT